MGILGITNQEITWVEHNNNATLTSIKSNVFFVTVAGVLNYGRNITDNDFFATFDNKVNIGIAAMRLIQAFTFRLSCKANRIYKSTVPIKFNLLLRKCIRSNAGHIR